MSKKEIAFEVVGGLILFALMYVITVLAFCF